MYILLKTLPKIRYVIEQNALSRQVSGLSRGGGGGGWRRFRGIGLVDLREYLLLI